jgi:hypothetical protein
MQKLLQIIKEVTKELEQVPDRAKERNNMKPNYTEDKKMEIVKVTMLNIVCDKAIEGLIKVSVEKRKVRFMSRFNDEGVVLPQIELKKKLEEIRKGVER